MSTQRDNKGRFTQGHKISLGTKRLPFSIEHRKKLSLAKKGKPSWNKGIKGSIKSNSGTFKKGITPWNKGRKYPQITGEKNKNWKGGITPINRKIRTSLEYKLWRESVFKRDDYTCIWCGEVGGRLHADHIKPFANFPELRFAIDNGRTLCVVCHKKTDSYLNPYYKPL